MANIGWFRDGSHRLHWDGAIWWISLSSWGLVPFDPMNGNG